MKQSSSKNELSVKELIGIAIDWLKYFATKWKFLLAAVCIGALGGYIASYLAKPKYIAELTFALEEKGGGGAYAGIASQFGLDIGGGEGGAFSGDNNMELLRSRMQIEQTLLTPVVINGEEDLLINRYRKFDKDCKKWDDNPNLASIKFVKGEPRESFTITKDSLLKMVYLAIKRENLEVNKIDKKLNIIFVKCTIEDELFAKYFVQVLVKNVSDFYIDTKTKKSKNNVEMLQNRVDSVRKALDSEIYGAAISKDQNMNMLRAQGNVQVIKKQMNVQVLTTMYGELVKNLELSKFTLMREEPLFQVIDYPVLPLERKRLKLYMGLSMGISIALVIMVVFLGAKRELEREPDPVTS